MSKIKDAMSPGTDLALNKTEIDFLLAAAEKAASFEKILKFKKGTYEINDEEVPLGTEYLAHTTAWSRSWVKFLDGNLVEKKVYSVAKNEEPPERDELDALDQNEWPKDKNGKPLDPWVIKTCCAGRSGDRRAGRLHDAVDRRSCCHCQPHQ